MVSTAWATPKVYLEAELGSDLQAVHGRIRIEEGPGVRLVDTQSLIPLPERDRDIRRTFPGPPEQGWMHIESTGPQEYIFHALLPRRHGSTGLSPGIGLFAHGTWFPQPTEAGELIEASWTVDLTVPEGHTIVLNGMVGRTEITWQGRAQTLSLAVLPEAHIEAMEAGEHSILWVRKRAPGEKRKRRLQASLDLLDSVPKTLPTVIVEAPLRRRLVRSGERQLYLSDRALRVSGGLWVHHAPAIARGVLQSGLPISDLWQRELAATALSDAALSVPSVTERLKLVSWIPEVEALLHDGRLPFYSEIFDESWSGDPVQDQLEQLISDDVPGRVMARRLTLLHGQSAVEQMAWDLSRGSTLEQASSRAGIPDWQITSWRKAVGLQDYSLSVYTEDERWRLQVQRDAPKTAPPEVIRVQVDGIPQTWVTDTGSDSHEIELGRRPRQVALDPDGIVQQTDPGNDVWPRQGSTTLAFFPYQLNLSRGHLSAAADFVYRPKVHGRQAWRFSVGTDEEDSVSGSLTLYHFAGPLRDRRTRPLRLWMGASAAILDPEYRPTQGTSKAIGAHAGAAWDTRDDLHFPLHGHRISLYGSEGWVPGADRWGSAHLTGIKVLSARGRLASVSTAHLGLAKGGVDHRLLSLGGTRALLSIPPGAVVGDRLMVGASELRLQIIRGASLPLPGMWLSDVNLSVGVEAGQLDAGSGTETETWQALGMTTGISFVADVLGVRPSLLGVWAGIPLRWNPSELVEERPIQAVVRYTHPF